MRKMLRTLFLLTLLGTVPAGSGIAAPLLTLDDYLKKVEANNPEIKAIDLSVDAMGDKVQELDMVYSPFLMAGYNYSNDRSGAGFGSTLPTKGMTVNSLNVSASKKLLFGANVTAGYAGSSAVFDLLEPTAIIGPDLRSSFTGYQMQPFVRVEQSLLRDFKSGLTQSGIRKAKASTLSGQYMQLFRRRQILTRARTAYWALSLSREVLAFRRTSLDRTEKLLKWNEKRVKLDLADQSDLLQAQAGYKLRQLNLQLAEEDLIKAGRDFNELLGILSDQVGGELDLLSDKISYYAGVPALERTGERADVLAARASFESSRFADRETFYRARPELSLSGAYSLNGLGLASSDAWSQVAGIEKPSFTLGLSLIVPLDYKTLNTVRGGYQ
ncbi:MAG: TolC family protein, partial [Endomicrobiales bacterium]